MGEFLVQIPDYIQDHIKELTKTSVLPNTEESVEKIAQAWLEKKKTFEEEISKMNMEEIDSFEKINEKGALVMTYSGSLVNVGPLVDNARKISYVSIGLRKDVPEMLTKENCRLASNIIIGDPVEFENGPVKKTSQVFKIVVCKEELSANEQEEIIDKATTVIIDEFVEVNKTIIDSSN